MSQTTQTAETPRFTGTPWKYEPDDGEIQTAAGEPIATVLDADDFPCLDDSADSSEANSDADPEGELSAAAQFNRDQEGRARLMASAPELLVLVEDFTRYTRNAAGGCLLCHTGHGEPCRPNCRREKAVQAIAKATGT